MDRFHLRAPILTSKDETTFWAARSVGMVHVPGSQVSWDGIGEENPSVISQIAIKSFVVIIYRAPTMCRAYKYGMTTNFILCFSEIASHFFPMRKIIPTGRCYLFLFEFVFYFCFL